MSGPECCSNPPTIISGGDVHQIGSLNSYVSGNPDSKIGVILISDVWGYEAPKLRNIADKLGSAGYYVAVPDFFHGDPLTPEVPIQDWLKNHAPVEAVGFAKSVIQALKEKGISKVAAAGFCWGAKVVVELAKSADIQVAALLHPSFVSLDDVKGVKVPTGILGAGIGELIAKCIESADLNFSRYGDTFFEVVFTGGRTQPGTTKPDEGERHTFSVLDCDSKREAILPSVIYLQKILRRRPFLIKNLENVMRRFLQSLEFFEENERIKLAIFTALAFSQKLSGLPPETVFQPLLKDNLVGKGLVLTFITDFFKEYLIDNSLDDLISILKRGKMEDNLLEFFPSGKRSAEAFSEHFTKAGMIPLVEYNDKKIFEVKVKEMKTAITTQISEEADISEVIETVKQHVKDAKLPEIEVVRILWDVLMDAVQWSGKNQQQNANLALRQVKTWAELLNTFCTSGKLELELLYKVQVQCYEDTKLMKLFPEIVRNLYDQDVLAEDTILHWFRKGTNPKGRQSFVKALEPFVKWLEEAEEEE